MKNKLQKFQTSFILLVITLACGCNKPGSVASGGGDEDEPTQASLRARIDKHGDEIMASSSGKAEARQWMGQRSHVFFKADPKVVAQFVEAFYGAGAPQVLITDIAEHDGLQYGEALLVVLPREAATRSKLFEVGSRADTQFQDDPVPDKRQKYLYYSLD